MKYVKDEYTGMTEKQEHEMYKRFAKRQVKRHLGKNFAMTKMCLYESGMHRSEYGWMADNVTFRYGGDGRVYSASIYGVEDVTEAWN